jgi:hypothetical protein
MARSERCDRISLSALRLVQSATLLSTFPARLRGPDGRRGYDTGRLIEWARARGYVAGGDFDSDIGVPVDPPSGFIEAWRCVGLALSE